MGSNGEYPTQLNLTGWIPYDSGIDTYRYRKLKFFKSLVLCGIWES